MTARDPNRVLTLWRSTSGRLHATKHCAGSWGKRVEMSAHDFTRYAAEKPIEVCPCARVGMADEIAAARAVLST